MLRFLFMLAVLGVAIYFLVRVVQARGLLSDGGGTAAHPPRPVRRPQKPKMVAPDDDEDFLRDLDRKRLEKDDPESP